MKKRKAKKEFKKQQERLAEVCVRANFTQEETRNALVLSRIVAATINQFGKAKKNGRRKPQPLLNHRQ